MFSELRKSLLSVVDVSCKTKITNFSHQIESVRQKDQLLIGHNQRSEIRVKTTFTPFTQLN